MCVCCVCVCVVCVCVCCVDVRAGPPLPLKPKSNHAHLRRTFKDDNLVSQVGGHDEIVLHNKRGLLAMQHKPLDDLAAQSSTDTDR